MKNNSLIIILVIAAFSLLINVGSYGVIESSDARYAEISRAMYVSGDYLHPNLMEVHHYHKPPFTYQITALGYRIFGINAFGARFFLQIAVLLQIVLLYYLSLELFNNQKIALWSVLIYFSFPIVLISSRNLTTDAFLNTFALLSMFAWVKYRKNGKYFYLYLFTMSWALGFLTKGPVIFIIPVFFIIGYNRIEKAKNSFSFHHLLAWLIFIGIAASWFIYLAMDNPAFIDYFLGKQTIDRFADKSAFHRTEPFWYFLAFAPLVGLPWLLLLPFMIKNQKELFSKRSIYKVLLGAVLIPLVFFSISSSKRILYILPLYSIFALLIAQLLYLSDEKHSKIYTNFIWGYAVLIFAGFILSSFIETGMLFSKVLTVEASVMLFIGVLLYRKKYLSTKSKAVYLSFIVGVFLLVSSSKIMSDNELKINASKPVTDFLIEKNLNNRNILIYNTRKPSIAFGLNKPVVSLYDGNYDLNRETQFEKDLNWKKYLINLKDEHEISYLKEVLKKPTVFLLYKQKLPPSLKWITEHYPNKKQMGKWIIYY
ncbi:MAG: glycosyltransferase family 39 protein [Bacteroidales bacterium]|nr:glycosyltransferase family 39 protein [Bacteroidales bacterium]